MCMMGLRGGRPIFARMGWISEVGILFFLRSSMGGVANVTDCNSSATWAAIFRVRGPRGEYYYCIGWICERDIIITLTRFQSQWRNSFFVVL